MRCKVFSVPLESEASLDRERKLNDFLGATNVKRVFASLAHQPEGPIWSVLFFYDESSEVAQRIPASPGAPVDYGPPLTGEQAKGMIALKKWRADQAALEGVPLYMVAQNKWLEEIVRMPARALDDLLKVRGLGEWRVQKYGAKILEILNAADTAKRSWPGSS
ncbi:MAG TPA: HRDC domain-containing protein [Terriglobia bacterium]|nr:HRDC domain-containing protein [Terriglobia bacterium]